MSVPNFTHIVLAASEPEQQENNKKQQQEHNSMSRNRRFATIRLESIARVWFFPSRAVLSVWQGGLFFG